MTNLFLEPYFLPLVDSLNCCVESYNLSFYFNTNHFVLIQDELFKIHRNYSAMPFSIVYKIYINISGVPSPLGICSSYQQIRQITDYKLNRQLGNLEVGQFHEVASIHFPFKFHIQKEYASQVSSLIDISSGFAFV